jgi:hypothetical protein
MEVEIWTIKKLIFYLRNRRQGRGSIGTHALVGEVCDAAAGS